MQAKGRVAIVGGGPAGATCARELGQRGLQVTLFEATQLGEKPCGGGVPARALREFPELGDEVLPRRVVRSIVIISPSGIRACLALRQGIHVFRRRDLDSFLRARAQRAGAILVPARVTAIAALRGGRWELRTSAGRFGPFDHLIGADGVRGMVRRSLCIPYEPGDLSLALFTHLPSISSDHPIVLKFLKDVQGYLWIFPRTDHLSAGICAPLRSVPPTRLEEELRLFVEEQSGKIAPATIKGYLIPACQAPPTSTSGGSWALIGDAGGFVDALTREGIAPAMRSGVEAARHLAEFGRARTPPLPADLHLAHRFQRSFFRNDFLDRMTRFAAGSGAVRRVLADLFTGNQGYSSLRRRLLMSAIPCGVELGWNALSARVQVRGSPAQ